MARWRQKRLARRARLSRNSGIPNSTGFKLSKLFVIFAKIGFVAIVLLVIATFVFLPLFAFNLPSPDKIVRREGFSTKILDRSGQPLYEIFTDERRSPVDIKDVPEYLKQATIAIEDKNFYQHQGFDLFGILRGFSRIFTQGRAQGGSTLTQQLVKNVLLTSERSLMRKIKEFMLAIQIENKYSKDEILQMYLNEAPYGGNTRGVESASQMYFGKSVSELTLIESAILAGLPQRPSYYSPFTGDKEAYITRTEAVLRRMREDGYITKEQEEQVVSELPNVKFADRGSNFKAPHFVQYVQRILEDRYGAAALESGLRVTTTLDLSLQEEAQKIVSEEIDKVKNLKITNGAAIVINPETGEILAMVGSRGFNDPEIDGQVNVTTALRQPGSAIKPIVYVTGFKKGFTPSTLLMDVETEFPSGAGQPPYVPVNYDGKYRGPIQVRYALGNSINIPAVKMVALVGVKSMLETAYEMGIKSLEPSQSTLSRVGLSVALGGGEVRLIELASAYGAFTNGGYRVDPVSILKVEDIKGKVLEEVKPKKSVRVLTPEEAYLIADILSDNDARKDVFGVNSQLNIPGRQIAVKTGTTNDRRDNWTVGGNQQVMVGVWVGNNDNSPMKQVASGVTGASPIWRRILLKALDGKPVIGFEMPSGIVTVPVDKISGYAAHEGTESRIEKFVKGTEPQDDPVYLRLKVCKTEGKLANPSDIASGNYEEKEYFVFKEEDPLAPKGSGVNKWQEGIDKWIKSQPDQSKYNPPTEYCSSSVPINVEFVTPTDRTSNLPNDFLVEAKIFAIDKLSEVTLEINGVKLRSFTSPPYKDEVSLPNGVHTLRVKARDMDGKESDRIITVGVNMAWDAKNTPTPTPNVDN